MIPKEHLLFSLELKHIEIYENIKLSGQRVDFWSLQSTPKPVCKLWDPVYSYLVPRDTSFFWKSCKHGEQLIKWNSFITKWKQFFFTNWSGDMKQLSQPMG